MGAIQPARFPAALGAALSALGVAAVAGLDFVSGVEIRVYPLYYLPIAFAAWYIGRQWALVISLLSTTAWVASNYYAGMHYSATAIWVFNACMHLVSFLVVGMLLAQLKTSLAHERELGRTDPLTALLNVRAFHEEARRVLSEARRKGRPVTAAYLDLDDFKSINERHGHHGGDETLRRVATAIRRSTRISDLAARVGGDEFVLVFPETGMEAARVALDRLREALAQTAGETGPLVTASVGAVVFEAIPESVEEMVRVADQWMYRAKAAGKDRVLLEAGGPAAAPVSGAGG
jgi:diguanylate cyclase (GGDEF)-like protein